jgi:hypothetical protein
MMRYHDQVSLLSMVRSDHPYPLRHKDKDNILLSFAFAIQHSSSSSSSHLSVISTVAVDIVIPSSTMWRIIHVHRPVVAYQIVQFRCAFSFLISLSSSGGNTSASSAYPTASGGQGAKEQSQLCIKAAMEVFAVQHPPISKSKVVSGELLLQCRQKRH